MNFYIYVYSIEVLCIDFSINGINLLFISYFYLSLDWWNKMEWKYNTAIFIVWISKRMRMGYNG